MGWASASQLANEIWAAVGDLIPEDSRQKAAQTIVEAFEERDADTLSSESEALYAAAYPWLVVEVDGDYYDALHHCATEAEARALLDKELSAQAEFHCKHPNEQIVKIEIQRAEAPKSA